MKFKTQFTAGIKVIPEKKREHKKSKKLTVPGMAFSIRDLKKKFAGGIDMQISKNGVYEENPDIDRPNPMRHSIDPLTDLEMLNFEHEMLQKSVKIRAASKPVEPSGSAGG